MTGSWPSSQPSLQMGWFSHARENSNVACAEYSIARNFGAHGAHCGRVRKRGGLSWLGRSKRNCCPSAVFCDHSQSLYTKQEANATQHALRIRYLFGCSDRWTTRDLNVHYGLQSNRPDGHQAPSSPVHSPHAHQCTVVMPNQPQRAINSPEVARKIALLGTFSCQHT